MVVQDVNLLVHQLISRFTVTTFGLNIANGDFGNNLLLFIQGAAAHRVGCISLVSTFLNHTNLQRDSILFWLEID